MGDHWVQGDSIIERFDSNCRSIALLCVFWRERRRKKGDHWVQGDSVIERFDSTCKSIALLCVFWRERGKYVVTITKKSCEKENDNDLFNLLFSESDEDVTKIISDDEGLD